MEHKAAVFIKQTAIDYGLDYTTVKEYYDWYYAKGTFYEMLEQKIAD